MAVKVILWVGWGLAGAALLVGIGLLRSLWEHTHHLPQYRVVKRWYPRDTQFYYVIRLARTLFGRPLAWVNLSNNYFSNANQATTAVRNLMASDARRLGGDEIILANSRGGMLDANL